MIKKKEKNKFVVFGVHPIIELLKAKKRKLYSIYTTKPLPKAWSKIEKYLPRYTQIQYVDKNVLARLAQSDDHQSVVALASEFQFRKKFFDSSKSPFLIMLDEVQDTRNFGAILRSSYCAGVDGVIFSAKAAAPLNAVALKSSAGLAEHLEIYRAISSKAAIQELKNAGYNIYLATLDGENANMIKYEEPLCIVIGNEAVGISKSILKSGKKVSLPQRSSDISYNASVAAGILLFTVGYKIGKI